MGLLTRDFRCNERERTNLAGERPNVAKWQFRLRMRSTLDKFGPPFGVFIFRLEWTHPSGSAQRDRAAIS
ncbi:hypothetical protein POX_b02873 [Penicillium oxalicum]|uniref:hypothetical protein n=1 Tax=Penicillium oxalicum TaxID=69781 RepID=UPI0020B75DFE|nr:hypothetical protein POX_b02873 [Penicillium oxalicum]KAI2792830.1 hypothetical protein POX_b02873 [Penicillium oxalicum]